jgi:transcriptional regulator of NAD metabolism
MKGLYHEVVKLCKTIVVSQLLKEELKNIVYILIRHYCILKKMELTILQASTHCTLTLRSCNEIKK